MRIISNTLEFSVPEKTAVALGKFDGLHLGHQELLKRILKKKEEGYLATVFTFDPSPLIYFGKGEEKELTTREEKRKIFEQMGVDLLVELPLNEQSAGILPVDFLCNVLKKNLNAGYIASGKDISFGYKGQGNAQLLLEYSEKLEIQADLIEKVKIGDRTVSSSAIREMVKEGKVEEAGALLGRAYGFEGTVLHGKQLGRRIGFPTLNLDPPKEKLLPPQGVYFSRVVVDQKQYHGITNIGQRPTVSDEYHVNVESHLLDYSGDAYEKEIQVKLLKYHRPERKFASLEELKECIGRDRAEAQGYFAKWEGVLV